MTRHRISCLTLFMLAPNQNPNMRENCLVWITKLAVPTKLGAMSHVILSADKLILISQSATKAIVIDASLTSVFEVALAYPHCLCISYLVHVFVYSDSSLLYAMLLQGLPALHKYKHSFRTIRLCFPIFTWTCLLFSYNEHGSFAICISVS